MTSRSPRRSGTNSTTSHASSTRTGAFVIFPGYEWSGNTGLGGDRNVMFMHEGRQIHRSSHALVDDLADVASDANSAGRSVPRR